MFWQSLQCCLWHIPSPRWVYCRRRISLCKRGDFGVRQLGFLSGKCQLYSLDEVLGEDWMLPRAHLSSSSLWHEWLSHGWEMRWGLGGLPYLVNLGTGVRAFSHLSHKFWLSSAMRTGCGDPRCACQTRAVQWASCLLALWALRALVSLQTSGWLASSVY